MGQGGGKRLDARLAVFPRVRSCGIRGLARGRCGWAPSGFPFCGPEGGLRQPRILLFCGGSSSSPVCALRSTEPPSSSSPGLRLEWREARSACRRVRGGRGGARAPHGGFRARLRSPRSGCAAAAQVMPVSASRRREAYLRRQRRLAENCVQNLAAENDDPPPTKLPK